MRLFIFAVASILAVMVKAQDQCSVGCAEATCPSNVTNVTCFCDQTNQTAIMNCLRTKCSPADVQAAQILQVAVCGNSPPPPLMLTVKFLFQPVHPMALEPRLQRLAALLLLP